MKQQQFTKDGHTVAVSSARAAVQLRYDGWTEIPGEEPEPAAEESAPAKATAKKTSK